MGLTNNIIFIALNIIFLIISIMRMSQRTILPYILTILIFALSKILRNLFLHYNIFSSTPLYMCIIFLLIIDS